MGCLAQSILLQLCQGGGQRDCEDRRGLDCVVVISCPQLQGQSLTQLQVCTCEHRSLLLHLPKQLTVHPRPCRGALPINHPLRLVSVEELNPFVIAALFPPTPMLLLVPCRTGSSWLPKHCASMVSGTTGVSITCPVSISSQRSQVCLGEPSGPPLCSPITSWDPSDVAAGGAHWYQSPSETSPLGRTHQKPKPLPSCLPFLATSLSCSEQPSSLQHQEHCW